LTDISLSEPAALSVRVETARRAGAGDTRFRIAALAAALAVLAIFAGVITSLMVGAMPAFKAFGFGFITTEAWNGCLLLSSFHTFPDEHTVVKTQSLIERRG